VLQAEAEGAKQSESVSEKLTRLGGRLSQSKTVVKLAAAYWKPFDATTIDEQRANDQLVIDVPPCEFAALTWKRCSSGLFALT
jgi:hypothetical protein